MENIKNITVDTIDTAADGTVTASAHSLPEITVKTTLCELLTMLDLGEKPPVPTPRE